MIRSDEICCERTRRLLKTASQVGPEFALSLVLSAYPIEQPEQFLRQEIQQLCEFNILKLKPKSKLASGPTGGRRASVVLVKRRASLPELTDVFVFVDGFMRDVAQSRMLIEQRKRSL